MGSMSNGSDNSFTTKIESIMDVWPGNGGSQYFRYGGDGYKSGVRHYLESSSDVAYAVIQPGSEEDLSLLMRFISGQLIEKGIRIPFAVRGGGHATNPGFSSTKGLQIAMTRFNKITFQDETLTVGAGCLFDEVYKELQRLGIGRNIVGGSATAGVGVAGFLLGGGYSLKTNQYGLGIDNIKDFDIVLTSGDILRKVSETNCPDLFMAVKGGGNNFGIVTQFTLETHRQTGVYGGLLTFGEKRVPAIKDAIVGFIDKSNDYPRAAIVAAFRYYNDPGGMEFKFTVQLFYDAPKAPEGLFKEFLVGPLGCNGGKVEDTMSYADLDARLSHMKEIIAHNYPPMAGVGENWRGRWGNVMVSTYTRALIDEVERQAKVAKDLMAGHRGKSAVTEIWPFNKGMFNKSANKPSAWPHFPQQPNGPLIVSFQWEGKENDEFWINHMKQALNEIRQVAISEGCATDDAPVYSNTTLYEDTSINEIYRGNLDDLREIRKMYDPKDIMSLTGGFRIPIYSAPTSNGIIAHA